MSRTYRKRILKFDNYYSVKNPKSFYNQVDDEYKNKLKYQYKTKTFNFLNKTNYGKRKKYKKKKQRINNKKIKNHINLNYINILKDAYD